MSPSEKPTTAGDLIDYHVRLAHRAQIETNMKLTEFVENLAIGTSISARHVNRMRDYVGFPEDKTSDKLIELIPSLSALDHSNFAGRLLLPDSQLYLDGISNCSNQCTNYFDNKLPLFKDRQFMEEIAIEVALGCKFHSHFISRSTNQEDVELSEEDLKETLNLSYRSIRAWRKDVITKNNLQDVTEAKFDDLVANNVSLKKFDLSNPDIVDFFALAEGPFPLILRTESYNPLIFRTAMRKHRGMLGSQKVPEYPNGISSEGWLRCTDIDVETITKFFQNNPGIINPN